MIEHVRPSKLVASLLEASELLQGAQLSYDDARSIVVVEGDTRAVDATETVIKLFDIERKSLRLRIKITSQVDKSTYETTVKLGNNQIWKTTDDASNCTVTLKPSLASDGKVQSRLIFETKGGSIESQIYLAPNHSTKLRGASEATELEIYIPFCGLVNVLSSLPAPEVEIAVLPND